MREQVVTGRCAAASIWCLVVVCFALHDSPQIDGAEFLASSLKPWTQAERVSAQGRTVLLNTSEGYGLWDLTNDRLELFPDVFWARDMSADGSVVVGNLQGGVGLDTPYQWTENEGFSVLDLDLAKNVLVTDISDDGMTLVGRFYGQDSIDSRPFRWTRESGVVTPILAPGVEWAQWTRVSGDGRVVVGGYAVQGAANAYRWTESTGAVKLEMLKGSTDHRISDVSFDGSVVVGTAWTEVFNTDTNQVENTAHEAFRWTEATGTVGLGSLSDATQSEARATSDDGNLVVGVIYEDSNDVAPSLRELFAWTATHGMVSLTDIIEDQLGIRLPPQSSIYDLSADNRVVIGASEGAPPGGSAFDYLSYGWAVSFDRPLQELVAAATISGDFNGNGQIDIGDIDSLVEAIIQASPNPRFDLDQSGDLEVRDLTWMVETMLGTWHGDVNLDGEFNSADLVAVFVAGQYEDGIPRNSTWATGDWNADQEFSSGDLVVVFQSGGYEQGTRNALHNVPEPSTVVLLFTTLFVYHAKRWRREWHTN